MNILEIFATWPQEAREAAQLVADKYGEPDEAQPSQLVWFNVGEWKRVVATRAFWDHQFPAPHHDSVESVIDYRVPPEMFSALAEFDGSVIARRTMGELSATCHDEGANRLALNLAHDIVTGERDVAGARAYYSTEFAGARRKTATPYMERLTFVQQDDAADPDARTITETELKEAAADGKKKN